MYADYSQYIVPREHYLFQPQGHESLYEYLLECHRRIAKDLGDYTAFVTGAPGLYAETPMSVLLRDVEQLAAFLAAQGIRKGDAVTAALPLGGPLLTVLFAANKLGAVLQLLGPETAEQALSAAVGRSKSKLAVLPGQQDQAASCNLCKADADGALTVVCSYAQALSQTLPAAKTVGGAGRAAAVLLPAEGTQTAAFSSFAVNTQIYRYYLMDMAHDYRKDHALAVLPCWTGAGLSAVLYALCNAYKPVLLPCPDAAQISGALRRTRVIEIFGDAAVFRSLLELPDDCRERLRHLRLLFCVGGGLGAEEIRRLDETLAVCGSVARLCLCYGNTRTFGAVTACCWQHFKPGTAGFPLAGVEVQIWDGDGKALPNGEPGEIVLAVDSMMNGLPDENGKEWIRPGDTGWLDDEGYLVVCGSKNTST